MRDIWTETYRHLRIIPRTPDLMLFTVLQPIMFIILFVYVFGSSIDITGSETSSASDMFTSYKQYLLPGIFVQTVVFGSSITGVGIADDMQKGLIERLRSLPMFQPAVLIGRTLSDLIRNVVTFIVMLVVAFLVGFRFDGSLLEALGASVLLLAFSYSFSWIQALIGLTVKSVETVQSAGFMWMFPMTFVSSTYVLPENLPLPLKWFASVNPFTFAVDASRALYNGHAPGVNLWQALGWTSALTLIFGFLAIRRFTRANRA